MTRNISGNPSIESSVNSKLILGVYNLKKLFQFGTSKSHKELGGVK